MTWGHDQLAHDLAAHLAVNPRAMIWENIPMGPAGSVRPDVFVMQKSFTKPLPTAYEVKVKVSDFRADITAGKWQQYLAFSGAVYFAAPKGLISRADLPKGCGLIVRGDAGWRTHRAPTRQRVTLAEEVYLKLLMSAGYQREGNAFRRADEWTARQRALKAVGTRLGRDIGEYLRDKDAALGKLELLKEDIAARDARSRERAKELMDDGAQTLRECCEALGIVESNPRRIRWAIEAALREIRDDERVETLRTRFHALARQFDRLKQHSLLQEPPAQEAAE